MTNRERLVANIQQMTNEELADALQYRNLLIDEREFCHVTELDNTEIMRKQCPQMASGIKVTEVSCVPCLTKWLESKSTEEIFEAWHKR